MGTFHDECPECGEYECVCREPDAALRYRTIVVDPPWHYDSWPGVMGCNSKWKPDGPRDNRRKPIDYTTMTVEEIAALPVADFADSVAGCRLFLWTTNRYLRDAFDVVEAWGFSYPQTLVWTKAPMGIGPGGQWAQNVEYILATQRGPLKDWPARMDSCWFNWPRTTVHSKKPEAFLDMVEQSSRPPYLEMFARRQRLGWDTWGHEALQHVEMAS